ncbi:Zinc finger and BTB domain-containing protein 8A.1-B, partial [Clarias magur]
MTLRASPAFTPETLGQAASQPRCLAAHLRHIINHETQLHNSGVLICIEPKTSRIRVAGKVI